MQRHAAELAWNQRSHLWATAGVLGGGAESWRHCASKDADSILGRRGSQGSHTMWRLPGEHCHNVCLGRPAWSIPQAALLGHGESAHEWPGKEVVHLASVPEAAASHAIQGMSCTQAAG